MYHQTQSNQGNRGSFGDLFRDNLANTYLLLQHIFQAERFN